MPFPLPLGEGAAKRRGRVELRYLPSVDSYDNLLYNFLPTETTSEHIDLAVGHCRGWYAGTGS
jgi:hypothetical protein